MVLNCSSPVQKRINADIPWIKTNLRHYEVIRCSKFLLDCRVVME